MAAEQTKAPCKYVLVSGGVISGIGKGILASSCALVLKSLGFKVTCIKIDPYLNIDAGTMSPYEHGEVFVLDDGGECDLDLGNYERFLGLRLTSDNNITTGKIYQAVISKERSGEFLGKTVQVVPHITDEIQQWIERVAAVPVDGSGVAPEVCVIELGGTVGDIESAPFIEALRQFQFRVGHENFSNVHVSLLPAVQGELKTKPTQHSVRELRAAGLSPDIIFARCSLPFNDSVRSKLSLFCQVPPESVIGVVDARNTSSVPLMLYDQGVWRILTRRLGLTVDSAHSEGDAMAEWRALVAHMDAVEDGSDFVRIAVVGKYVDHADTYVSVTRALQHAALAADRKLELVWVESTDLEGEEETSKAAWDAVRSADGVLVPGGFGDRGVEGKIAAAKYAREGKVPFLGICLGMQVAVIEFARTVLDWDGANSAEFDSATKYPVVVFMPEIDPKRKGGTLRLGRKQTILQPQSITARLYGGATTIEERHRHRYEVATHYVPHFEKRGMHFVGQDATKTRMECIELAEAQHPFFVGCQAHPEFLSLPGKPSPLYLGFVRASIQRRQQH